MTPAGEEEEDDDDDDDDDDDEDDFGAPMVGATDEQVRAIQGEEMGKYWSCFFPFPLPNPKHTAESGLRSKIVQNNTWFSRAIFLVFVVFSRNDAFLVLSFSILSVVCSAAPLPRSQCKVNQPSMNLLIYSRRENGKS